MKNTFESRARARTLALLAVAVFGVSAVAVGNPVVASPALNLVQVGLQTTQNHPYQYTMTAYNTSGYQVASYQSSYPGAAFQLPTGTYLLTASAYYQNSTLCYVCVQPAGGSSAGGAAATVIKPYYGPYTEYGYSLTQVNGPVSIAIGLKNATALPLTKLAIHVAYANGTAAADASVSGYVVGSYYVYSAKTVSYGQTNKAGDVTLTMPQAPVDVSAYLSVPIKLPKNTSTVTVNVGGQKVNVTVYLQPSYISLRGEALLLPPQTSTSMTLQYQPENYPIVYAGTSTPATVGGTVSSAVVGGASSQASSSNQTQAATRIAPFTPGGALVTTTGQAPGGGSAESGIPAVMIEVAAVGAALVLAAAVAALFMRKTRSGAPAA